ncbi:hypothetical protein GGR56DRAFT_246706 [Xylariaceae sp. FL0804]|nr:hypothetical protein GGR56DRAFT_246706 [Xylariaceae sp. FL0804]
MTGRLALSYSFLLMVQHGELPLALDPCTSHELNHDLDSCTSRGSVCSRLLLPLTSVHLLPNLDSTPYCGIETRSDQPSLSHTVVYQYYCPGHPHAPISSHCGRSNQGKSPCFLDSHS